MAYPQLTGRTAQAAEHTTGRAVFMAILALALILGMSAWRLIPHPAAAPQPSEVTVQPVQPAPETLKPSPTEDQQLHMAHAEQQLVAAAEQLATARRLLAVLSPALSRNYLQFEKRRAESAWTACDSAQRAIEQARDDIKLITTTGKD
jgi:hypothetical protein